MGIVRGAWGVTEARDAIGGLIEAISLERGRGQLRIVLKASLAGMLRLAQENKRRRRPTTFWTKYLWLRGRDLNPRPLGYEPNELPDCSTPRQRKPIVTRPAHGAHSDPSRMSAATPAGSVHIGTCPHARGSSQRVCGGSAA